MPKHRTTTQSSLSDSTPRHLLPPANPGAIPNPPIGDAPLTNNSPEQLFRLRNGYDPIQLHADTGHHIFQIFCGETGLSNEELNKKQFIASWSQFPSQIIEVVNTTGKDLRLWRQSQKYRHVLCRFCFGLVNSCVLQIAIGTSYNRREMGFKLSHCKEPKMISRKDYEAENTCGCYVDTSVLPEATDISTKFENTKIDAQTIDLKIVVQEMLEGIKLSEGMEFYKCDTELKIKFQFGCDSKSVFLIVDAGNSRSMALLLEAPEGNSQYNLSQFAQYCRSLQFVASGRPISADATEIAKVGMLNSWFVLRYPMFHSRNCLNGKIPMRLRKLGKEPRRILEDKYTAGEEIHQHCFVSVSPMTSSAPSEVDSAERILENLNPDSITNSMIFFLSSPKRQIHQTQLSSRSWGCYGANVEALDGLIRYLSYVGKGWKFEDEEEDCYATENPPFTTEYDDTRPVEPAKYQLAESIVWMFLVFLERAAEQINSVEYRKGRPQRWLYLKGVQITFPSDLTSTEYSYYEAYCKMATRIYEKAFLGRNSKHLEEEGLRVECDLDEPVSSQLPFVAADLAQLGMSTLAWMQLYGREEKKEDGKSDWKARVIHLDVGGGTCDLSITEWMLPLSDKTSNEATIQFRVIYRFSSTQAGDELVRRLIGQILLPCWIKKLTQDNNKSVAKQLVDFYGPSSFATDRRLAPIFLRSVLIPIINKWLAGEDITKDEELPVWESFWKRMGYPNGAPSIQEYCTCRDQQVAVNECIKEWANGLVPDVASLCAVFDVDLAYVSGKPSELEGFKKVVRDTLPLSLSAIQFAKGYPVGDYYPSAYLKNGKIADAKSVTVVGAALYRASKEGWLDGTFWKRLEGTENDFSKYEWGILQIGADGNVLGFKNGTTWNFETDVEHEVEIPVGGAIGIRSSLTPHVAPRCLYILREKNEGVKQDQRNSFFTITVKRKERPDGKTFLCEELDLADVTYRGKAGEDMKKCLELRLDPNPGSNGSFWMDNPRFNIQAAYAQE